MKTKALISCMGTAQLICAFVFAYAKNRFSHDLAHMFPRCCYRVQMYETSDHIVAPESFEIELIQNSLFLKCQYGLTSHKQQRSYEDGASV